MSNLDVLANMLLINKGVEKIPVRIFDFSGFDNLDAIKESLSKFLADNENLDAVWLKNLVVVTDYTFDSEYTESAMPLASLLMDVFANIVEDSSSEDDEDDEEYEEEESDPNEATFFLVSAIESLGQHIKELRESDASKQDQIIHSLQAIAKAVGANVTKKH